MTKPTVAEKETILAMPPEHYMNAQQKDFFRRLLGHDMKELRDHIAEMKQQLQIGEESGDEGDIAIREEQLRLLFRQIDRESRLIPKYEAALQRIEKGEYGFCQDTGEPIGLQRLMLRPTAELSIEAKIKEEKVEMQYRKK
ncbi:RNA polymerase-binding protein DksA [Dryocola sp. BD613]|uniref:RNA polymerase-binding protein DksA n=1 Tax=Dryocola sp. BD613 TaxID=3133272 RepID=UPI003F4F848D